MKNLDNVINYKLILTKDCNKNCLYCIQCGEDRIINDETVLRQLSPQELSNYISCRNPITMTFFGGEPLLKFEYMVDLTRILKEKNNDNVFSVVTNGSLLTRDKVKIINELGIRVTISHDGVCYKETRRSEDILITKGDVIAGIEKLGFICTITNKNWDFYANWEYFERFRLKYGIKRPTVCITSVRDLNGNIDPSLFVFKSADFEKMLDKVFYKLKKSIINRDYNSYEYKCFRRVIERVYYEGILKHGVTPCISKKEVLNLDTYGNIYACHNKLDILDGNIYNLENVKDTAYSVASRCKVCSLEWLCPKCPRVLDDKRKYYCYFQKQVFDRLLNMFNELLKEGVNI